MVRGALVCSIMCSLVVADFGTDIVQPGEGIQKVEMGAPEEHPPEYYMLPDDGAERLRNEAEAAYNLKNFEEAIEKWKQAFEILQHFLAVHIAVII